MAGRPRSTHGRGAIKPTRSTQPSMIHPSEVSKSSTSLHGWGLAVRVHLCRVAGNTVWSRSRMASDVP